MQRRFGFKMRIRVEKPEAFLRYIFQNQRKSSSYIITQIFGGIRCLHEKKSNVVSPEVMTVKTFVEKFLRDETTIGTELERERNISVVETTTFSYDNANRMTGQTNANGSTVTNTYDNANRTTDVLHKTSANATLAHYAYAYDGVNNVTTRTDTDGTVTTFGYDSSDQVTSEARDNSHSTAYTIGYTYDHNQNRKTKVLNGTTDSYTYDSHDHLLSTSSKSYTYDANGNCKTVVSGTSTTTLTYDDENRVTGIAYPSSATNSFTYNGLGLRVSKNDSAGAFAYVCDGTDVASAVLKDGRRPTLRDSLNGAEPSASSRTRTRSARREGSQTLAKARPMRSSTTPSG